MAGHAHTESLPALKHRHRLRRLQYLVFPLRPVELASQILPIVRPDEKDIRPLSVYAPALYALGETTGARFGWFARQDTESHSDYALHAINEGAGSLRFGWRLEPKRGVLPEEQLAIVDRVLALVGKSMHMANVFNTLKEVPGGSEVSREKFNKFFRGVEVVLWSYQGELQTQIPRKK